MVEVSQKYASGVSANIFGSVYMVNADIAATFDTSKAISNRYAEYYEINTKEN